MVRFQRPPGPLNIWKVVDGFEVLEDGTKKPVKFSIQEIPYTFERKQEVIDLMCNHYLDDEAIAKCLKFKEDADAINDFKTMWNYAMNYNIAVGCYKLDTDGKIGELVGANIVYIVTDETEKDLAKFKAGFKSKNFLKMWELMELLLKKCDVKKIYNVDKYMGSICLCVNSAYRGQKLGYYMLDARKEIGKKYGCLATSTVFSVPTSQKQAARAGFEEGFTIEYKDVVDDKGNPIFPNIESTCAKQMIRRLD